MSEKMVRSIGEWFNEIQDDEVCAKAIKNTKNCSKRTLEDKALSLHDAIDKGMTWSNTPEDHGYWSKKFFEAQKGLL